MPHCLGHHRSTQQVMKLEEEFLVVTVEASNPVLRRLPPQSKIKIQNSKIEDLPNLSEPNRTLKKYFARMTAQIGKQTQPFYPL